MRAEPYTDEGSGDILDDFITGEDYIDGARGDRHLFSDGDMVDGEGPGGNSNAQASSSAGERPVDRDNTEENNSKRQRINVVMDANQKHYKEDISRNKQDKVLEAITEHSIVELYSPPRSTKIAERYGISSNGSFDITIMDPDDNMPWDLNKKEKRDKVRHIIKTCRPTLVIGSPMCTAFSSLQNMNKSKQHSEERKKAMKEAVMHMKFACEIYEMQIEDGRYFLHEHPLRATSWQLECIQRVRSMSSVMTVTADQCMFGLKTKGEAGKLEFAKKPTRFMTNSVLRNNSRVSVMEHTDIKH